MRFHVTMGSGPALVALLLTATVLPGAPSASAQTAGNAACPGEEVFYNPAAGEDIFVPPGYKVEVFASGLNFPTNIAFRRTGKGGFEVFVTEGGAGLPGRCNDAAFFKTTTGKPDGDNPFLPQVRVLDSHGGTLRFLGRPPSVAQRGSDDFLHAPTIGVTFESHFGGGRLFVSDSRQQTRDGRSSNNSSRIVELDPVMGTLTQRITGLPTGDHPTEQLTVKGGFLYWSQGSATNSSIVGHDNGGGTGQHDIPCQSVVLSGNNFDSGDGHLTAGYKPHGSPGTEGEVVPAFSGATRAGMCTGAILRARLASPATTVEPFSWGYRNPFGLRFAPDNHPLRGALLVSENGEDERGARPTNNAPDRLQVTRGGLDYHGWPDRFGFLDSTQAVFNPVGGPGDDCIPCSQGKPVRSVLLVPPQPPVSPLSIEPADVAVVGLDFAPGAFAGGGNPGDTVARGDALVGREGDFGFSAANGEPEAGHDIMRVHFLADGRNQRERFVFNCRASNQVMDPDGSTRCIDPGDQAFTDVLRGINRPVDGKFGPDGAFYLVDFGAVRDFGQSDRASRFQIGADAPLVQIPGTGVIWKISRIGGGRAGEDMGQDD
jgi:glucose/arabinose dehydrogenase